MRAWSKQSGSWCGCISSWNSTSARSDQHYSCHQRSWEYKGLDYITWVFFLSHFLHFALLKSGLCFLSQWIWNITFIAEISTVGVWKWCGPGSCSGAWQVDICKEGPNQAGRGGRGYPIHFCVLELFCWPFIANFGTSWRCCSPHWQSRYTWWWKSQRYFLIFCLKIDLIVIPLESVNLHMYTIFIVCLKLKPEKDKFFYIWFISVIFQIICQALAFF